MFRSSCPYRVALVFERKKVILVGLVEATVDWRDDCRLADWSRLSDELILVIIPVIDALYARLYYCVM